MTTVVHCNLPEALASLYLQRSRSFWQEASGGDAVALFFREQMSERQLQQKMFVLATCTFLPVPVPVPVVQVPVQVPVRENCA